MQIHIDTTTPRIHKIITSTLREIFNPDGDGDGFRTLCLGNPERSIQGRLVSTLSNSGIKIVSECGLSTSDRSVDAVIFNNYWTPACAIEIKHHHSNNPNQFSQSLIKGMRADISKHADSHIASLPLTCIGIQTSVQSIHQDSDIKKSHYYRFLKYFPEPVKHIDSPSSPPDLRFQHLNSVVVGRVNFVVFSQFDGQKLCSTFMRSDERDLISEPSN